MRGRKQLIRRIWLLAVVPGWVALGALALAISLLGKGSGTKIAGVILAMLVADAGWALLCLYMFHGFYNREQQEMLEAGAWVLNRALGRRIALESADVNGGPSPLQQNLDDWQKAMVEDLRQRQDAQALELQRDLDLARDFQMSYMNRPYPVIPAVHIPGHLRLSFAHCYKPASALGGDFYNIVTLASDCAGIFIADVMDHGTRSALITAMIRTLIDDLTPQGRNARHFMKELNRQFCAMLSAVPGTQFASAFYFVADTTSRIATFSSAGHPAPIYVNRTLGRLHRVDVPMPRGSALGVIPDEDYTAGHCRLNDGDLFVFFTDGLFEAHNAAGEEFGIIRMEKTLHKLMYHPGKAVVDGLVQAVLSFVGKEPIADDICLVAVEVSDKAVEKGPATAAPSRALIA